MNARVINEYKKAAEHLREYIGNDCYTDEFQRSCEIAVKAIEKRIPQKSLHEDGTLSSCPYCGRSIYNDSEQAVNGEVEYCSHCGQAIDWKEGWDNG